MQTVQSDLLLDASQLAIRIHRNRTKRNKTYFALNSIISLYYLLTL